VVAHWSRTSVPGQGTRGGHGVAVLYLRQGLGTLFPAAMLATEA